MEAQEEQVFSSVVGLVVDYNLVGELKGSQIMDRLFADPALFWKLPSDLRIIANSGTPDSWKGWLLEEKKGRGRMGSDGPLSSF